MGSEPVQKPMESNNEETPQNDAQESLVAHDSESKTSFKNETEATKKSEIKFKRSPSLESCSEDEKTVIKNSENPSKENLEQCVPSTANQIDPNSLDVSEFVQSNSKISALIVPSNAKENSILDSGNPESMTYKDELKSMEDDGLSLRNIIKKIAHLFFSTLSNTSKEKELDEIAKKELKNMMLDDQNTTENQKFKRFPVIISYPQSQRPKQPFMNAGGNRNNRPQQTPNPPSYYTSALTQERLQSQREQMQQQRLEQQRMEQRMEQQRMEQQRNEQQHSNQLESIFHPQLQPHAQSSSQQEQFFPPYSHNQPERYSVQDPFLPPQPQERSSHTDPFVPSQLQRHARQSSKSEQSFPYPLRPQAQPPSQPSHLLISQQNIPSQQTTHHSKSTHQQEKAKTKSFSMPTHQNSQHKPDVNFAPNVYEPDQTPMMPNVLLNISFWAPYPDSIPSNIPPCLAHLVAADSLFIIQKLDIIELFMDMAEPNYFLIQNEAGQCLYYVYESTGLTFCCDNCRGFQLHVMDMYHNEIIYINKPCGCNNCFCCYPVLEVYSPPMVPVGAVTQKINAKRIEFAILDADENLIFKIYGPCCCLTFGETDFTIHAVDWEKTEVGCIRRQWGGYVKTFFTNTDYYGITFPVDLDVRLKAVFLGALFLIDYSFYDHRVPVLF